MVSTGDNAVPNTLQRSYGNIRFTEDINDVTFNTINSNSLTNLGDLEVRPSSSFTMVSDASYLSGDVDRWIHGSQYTMLEDTGVRRRAPVARSIMAAGSSLTMNSLWCVLAMVLPIFNFTRTGPWSSCTPSNLLSATGMFVSHLAQSCLRVRTSVVRFLREQSLRAACAAALDALLVVYALGFLVISLYQASLIG